MGFRVRVNDWGSGSGIQGVHSCVAIVGGGKEEGTPCVDDLLQGVVCMV